MKYVIHYKDGEAVDWVGNVLQIIGDNVVIQCVDAVMLRCGKWWLSDQEKTVLVSECSFFESMVDAKNACDTANAYFA